MAGTDLAPQELRVIVAVEREGGFTAAAAALGTTQSAVSHAVRAVERKLGAVLFTRGRAGAAPTPAGAKAAAHARRALRLLDTLAAEVRGTGAGPGGADTAAGVLRIAAFRSAALHLLPPALERLRAQHPAIEPRVRVIRELGPGTAGEVAAGRADLALATLDGGRPPTGLTGAALFEEPYALVHPAGHPEPRSLPLVDWHENCGAATRDWWRGQDWLPSATVEAEDDGTVLSLVGAGHGMAVMPALSLTSAPESVTVVRLGPRPPTRAIGYVTTPELARSLAVRALIRELRAQQGPR
ncbi:transcriptional regulator, LysR family protein [Streptomyces albus]|uniref:Transcriptional regulator, LysR family protein n=1 Tax=Streptomyces albus (strain ATCC 21838 / DSM 41398 / FERM P-419 / JCM 4703 / NBRC 107858) TaxID=1081613 RepID=A0A0B5ES30_STRA4|nr:transcriptional regulator, LysR family protein [Streptomyces albus]AOU76407.1 transcriptional regulator, LysR family protein [Streptomyces albus]AYN32193.1 LysR family transcriptional regulator [Streptomyces albus]